jgi:Crp-like helix-turn-helix protein
VPGLWRLAEEKALLTRFAKAAGAGELLNIHAQEFLAEMLGVRRSSVSPVANELQRTGLIRYSRGHIEILDLEGLQSASCECYGTVKAHYDRLLNHSATK